MESEGTGVYSSRVASTNLIINKNGHGEMYDLCDECLEKFDIFMSGKMPTPEYKYDELAYLELPNPSICVYEKNLLTGLGRGSEIDISADLEPFNRLIEGHGYAYLPLSAVKQVILGVHLR